MKGQVSMGALLLASMLAGSGYTASIALQQQQQGQQNGSGQQPNQPGQGQQGQQKKKDQQGGNQQQNQQQGQGQPQGNPSPQQGNQQGQQNNGDKPTPLFGGTIGLKSSRQTKDSATLGFNGVDPNGQVQKAMLSGAATPTDSIKAQQLAQLTVTPGDLVQFLQDGGLNPNAAPQKP
jgi:hypothetical protein